MWLQDGNENTKFFHRYADCGKNINSVWKTKKDNDIWATNFNEIVIEGVKYFESIYKTKRQDIIVEFLRFFNTFPRIFNSYDNQALMEEMGKEELHLILQSF